MKNNQGPLSKDEMAFLFKFAAENGIKAKKPIESKHQVSPLFYVPDFLYVYKNLISFLPP